MAEMKRHKRLARYQYDLDTAPQPHRIRRKAISKRSRHRRRKSRKRKRKKRRKKKRKYRTSYER